MINIEFEDIIKTTCPELRVASIECEVVNTDFNAGLWAEIDAFTETFRKENKIEDINKRPAIAATRMAYKRLSKDPNRYRPSAEALCRRIIKGDDLYKINTLVDLINLVSLETGYSIGGFDANKIEGKLSLGTGKKDEVFNAIGRGVLNIENLPVYRDQIGGIGTPTSDEERTKISSSTSRLLMIINAYSGEEGLQYAIDLSKTLINKYVFNNTKAEFQINLY